MSALTAHSLLLNDFLRDIAPAFYVRPLHGDPLPAASQIKIDVKEAQDVYTVHADMPGVAKDDIQVFIDGDQVTLKAEVKQHDSTGDGVNVLRSERYYGSVTRSFQLPVEIDQSQARAKFENGVLTLTLPKKLVADAAQRLQIE